VRYEDVSGPLGDDPQDRELFRHEPDWLDDKPTRADTDADERELRFARYDDGRGL
jgi:hypothetical protein